MKPRCQCGRVLPERRRKWCSNNCADRYRLPELPNPEPCEHCGRPRSAQSKNLCWACHTSNPANSERTREAARAYHERKRGIAITPELAATVLGLRAAGRTRPSISREVGISWWMVMTIERAAGVQPRPKSPNGFTAAIQWETCVDCGGIRHPGGKGRCISCHQASRRERSMA